MCAGVQPSNSVHLAGNEQVKVQCTYEGPLSCDDRRDAELGIYRAELHRPGPQVVPDLRQTGPPCVA